MIIFRNKLKLNIEVPKSCTCLQHKENLEMYMMISMIGETERHFRQLVCVIGSTKVDGKWSQSLLLYC